MSQGIPTDDRREHQRQPIAVRVHVADMSVMPGSLSRDLSQGGVMLETKSVRARGTLIPLVLIDPIHGDEIALMGRVVRVVRDGKAVRGLAVEFLYTDEKLAAKLKAFIERASSSAEDASKLHMQEIGGLPPDAVPAIVGDAPGTPEQLHLLSLVNGQHTVDDVVRRAGLPVSEALRVLQELRTCGAIALRESPAASGQPGAAMSAEQARFVEERVAAYVESAEKAEKQNRLPAAVRSLQLAIDLRPKQPAKLHLKLGSLALYRLNNIELAERHVVAAAALEPENIVVRRLLDEIAEYRTERAVLAANKNTVAAPASTQHQPMTPRRRAVAVALGAVLLAVVIFNAWRYLGPSPGAPEELNPSTLTEFVPATRVRFTNDRVYVTVESGWDALQDKPDRLGRAFERLQSQHSVQELIVSDPTPRLLARVRDGEVTVFGE